MTPETYEFGSKAKSKTKSLTNTGENIMSDERIELEEDGMDYSTLLKSIKHNMDPNNNTALLIDDERGIRKMVARSLKGFAPNLKIYEAANGREGLNTLEKIRKTHTRDP